jgi:hypothetical protein
MELREVLDQAQTFEPSGYSAVLWGNIWTHEDVLDFYHRYVCQYNTLCFGDSFAPRLQV